MRWFSTLRARLLAGSLFLLLIVFGLYAYFSVRFYTDEMMSQVLQSATRLSDLIKSSTYYSMLLNRKEDVYQIINMIGTQQGVEGIRIYNKRGQITFSTDAGEQGSVVDLRAEACYGCHDQEKPLESVPMDSRMRIYKGSTGHRVLGLINPIRNEQQCSSSGCHTDPEERTVLGVLDVRMSLENVDQGIAQSQLRIVVTAILSIVFVSVASVAFLNRTVLRPVNRLIEGAQAIAAGDHQYRFVLEAEDEIGRLARSFNEMLESLRQAEEENHRWSETLEQRVQEKTEELQKIHRQILQIEKMASLGKLSATVAHELNNPLEGILTYARLIGRRLEKKQIDVETIQEMLEDVDLIRRETERCGTIVKNLLLFSKKQVAEFAVVPVKQIVQKVEQLMRHHFDISEVRFSASFEDEQLALLCDENQLQQALVALCVNAVEAMPDGGELRIEVKPGAAAEELSILVKDTGVGISQEDVPHVFEPFFTTKSNGQGVGLGLSVVYGIVERHGGRISVDSERGKGTTFTMTFPSSGGGDDRRENDSARRTPERFENTA